MARLVNPQSDLYQRLVALGWELKKIDFSNGQYVARAANEPAGMEAERTGRTPEEALLGVLRHAERASEIRRYAALRKLGAWQTSWIDQKEEIAKAYRALPVFDPKALPAWEALANETRAQAKAIMRQIDVQVVDDPEPYETAQEMCEDIKRNGRFLVSRANSDHPVWSPEDNINFRIVHDVIGHCQSGGDFSWRGENMACGVHFPLVSSLAQEALFTECIGQTAYYSFYRGFGPQKVGLMSEFLQPVQQAEGAHVWVPHGGLMPQHREEEDAKRREDDARQKAVYDQEMQKNLPASPVFELPSVSEGWKAKPAPAFKPRRSSAGPQVGDRFRGAMGAVLTVVGADPEDDIVALRNPNGRTLKYAFADIERMLASGELIPLGGDGNDRMFSDESVEEGAALWPDTVPGDWRAAGVYDWKQAADFGAGPGWGALDQGWAKGRPRPADKRSFAWKEAMPVVRPKGVDAYLEQLVGPGEQHESPDRRRTGVYCDNPKCSREMTWDEYERAEWQGGFQCPACGHTTSLDPNAPWRETRVGLSKKEVGDIGEGVVLGMGTVPGLGTFSSASDSYNFPVDAILDGEDGVRYGVEIKSNHSQAQERFKVGSQKARAEKIRYCHENGLTPALVGVRLNFYTDRADVFFRPQLTDTWVGNSQMRHVGTFDFAHLNPFQAPTPEEKKEAVDAADIPDTSLGPDEGEGRMAPSLGRREVTAASSPNYAFVYYAGELRVLPWHRNFRFRGAMERLLREFGVDLGNSLMDIDPVHVAAGLIYTYPDGEYRVEHKQLSNPDVRREAERLIGERRDAWREIAT
jgi:hypothetical protein